MNESRQAMLADRFVEWVEKYAAKVCPPGCLPLPAQEREISLFAEITRALRASAPQEDGRALEPNEIAARLQKVSSYQYIGEFARSAIWDAIAALSAPPSVALEAPIITDEMVDRAWAGIVGWDIADICQSVSIIKADLRDGLEAALTHPQPKGEQK